MRFSSFPFQVGKSLVRCKKPTFKSDSTNFRLGNFDIRLRLINGDFAPYVTILANTLCTFYLEEYQRENSLKALKEIISIINNNFEGDAPNSGGH